MQSLAYNTAATAQAIIAPAQVNNTVKNILFAAIVTLIALAVNL